MLWRRQAFPPQTCWLAGVSIATSRTALGSAPGLLLELWTLQPRVCLGLLRHAPSGGDLQLQTCSHGPLEELRRES